MAAQLRAQFKRAVLNSLYRQATTQVPLLSILEAYQDALVAGTKGGRVVEATSQSGHSVKFRTPNPGESFRAEVATELTEQFIEVYNDSVAALNALGIPSPTDAQIVAQMMQDDRLLSITVTRSDFTWLRYPGR